MGRRGPVPKRTSARLGHLTRADKAAATTLTAAGAVGIPEPNPEWHPLARDWYLSLSISAQCSLMEPSDWVSAQVVAGELTRLLLGPPNAVLFGKVWQAMGELMSTEGARRRIKIEVERKTLTAAPAPVAQIDDYRAL